MELVVLSLASLFLSSRGGLRAGLVGRVGWRAAWKPLKQLFGWETCCSIQELTI